MHIGAATGLVLATWRPDRPLPEVASGFVALRSEPESARASGREPCATMSLLTCYQTSRSFHFPFGAVCSESLSGTQPEFSLGRLQPHVEKDILPLFVASSIPRPSASARVRGPRPGPLRLGPWRPIEGGSTVVACRLGAPGRPRGPARWPAPQPNGVRVLRCHLPPSPVWSPPASPAFPTRHGF